MELQIISSSISALSATKALKEKINSLESQIKQVTEKHELFKEKVKKAIKENNEKHKNQIQLLTQQIEELEMVKNYIAKF